MSQNTEDAISYPKAHDFATVNEWVHDTDRFFEELQCACLGLATELEAADNRLKAFENGTASECARAAIRSANALATKNDRLINALLEAEAGLIFAGADKPVPAGEFDPAPTAALRIVREALTANDKAQGAAQGLLRGSPGATGSAAGGN